MQKILLSLMLMFGAGVAQAEPLGRDRGVSVDTAVKACAGYHAGRAIVACTTVLQASDEDGLLHPVAHINRAFAFLKSGAHRQAADDYTAWLAFKPEDAEALNNRGIALRALGELDAAIADYSSAIALEPDFERAYYNRALALSDKKEFERAIGDYTVAISLGPKRAERYFYNRGNAHFDAGDYDLAIADYSNALELNPAHAESYLNRGFAYGKLGEETKAKVNFKAAMDILRRKGLA